jgi:hypothetical protein
MNMAAPPAIAELSYTVFEPRTCGAERLAAHSDIRRVSSCARASRLCRVRYYARKRAARPAGSLTPIATGNGDMV